MQTVSRTFAVLSAFALVLMVFGTLWAASPELINLNEASVEQLAQLDRIGPAYAAKIVEYRELNGPFLTLEDIMKVKGIGPKTLEVNKDRMTVDKKIT